MRRWNRAAAQGGVAGARRLNVSPALYHVHGEITVGVLAMRSDDEFDLYGDIDEDDSVDPDVSKIIDHHRDTLTPEMAARFIRGRFGHEPPEDPEQLEVVIEALIADAYNDGWEDWDRFPY